jgi:hypothetical protein
MAYTNIVLGGEASYWCMGVRAHSQLISSRNRLLRVIRGGGGDAKQRQKPFAPKDPSLLWCRCTYILKM